VLRPPTFARLGQVLRDAAERGEPYHVVHFDGHGTWADLAGQPSGSGVPGWLRSQQFAGRAGAHGWLLFERPGAPGNVEYVDGPALGGLLAETGVPVLVLNACRSAHADLATTPEQATQAAGRDVGDVHARVRAYGSLAQEVMDAGVAGVVAMRYSVYVVTAAQFVGELYGALLAGRRLGEAVTRARKHLADQPVREVGLRPVRVQDWMVPVVYEATELPVVAAKVTGRQVEITLDPVTAARERGALESELPDAPDVGFFGRDETLLAVDLLEDLDLAATVITADALHTQREHADWLVTVKHAAYVLIVKGNQPALHRQLKILPWRDILVSDHTRDRGHGRVEFRRLQVTTVAGLDFPHATQALRITRRVRSLHHRRWRTVTVYAVTNLTAAHASPARLADWIRGHWAIEALHHIPRHHLRRGRLPSPHRQHTTSHGQPTQPRHRHPARPRPPQHRRRATPQRPRRHPSPATAWHHKPMKPTLRHFAEACAVNDEWRS
jgi:predicted transposase YbfD/YdcC